MTNSPLARLEYDRELIAEMLDDLLRAEAVSEDRMTTEGRSYFSVEAIAEQARLLREVENQEARAVTTTLRAEPVVGEWLAIESAPYATWVLAWLHLPKNPIASSWAIAQRCNVEKDESAADYSEHQRRTVGCWWAHGRYYPAGHVIAYQPLPPPPAALPGLGGRDG